MNYIPFMEYIEPSDSGPDPHQDFLQLCHLLQTGNESDVRQRINAMTAHRRALLQTEARTTFNSVLSIKHRHASQGMLDPLAADAEGPGGMSPGYELNLLSSLLQS